MLISPEYRALNEKLHEDRDYGRGGKRWMNFIHRKLGPFRPFNGMVDMLDYGCGKGTLGKLMPFFIDEYDPCVPEKSARPEPHWYVICTDVLEHIEPECIDDVLADLAYLTLGQALLVIATRPANKCLPDGRNAHLIVEDEFWWKRKLAQHFTTLNRYHNVSQEGEFAVIVESIHDHN